MKIKFRYIIFSLFILMIGSVAGYLILKFAVLNTGISIKYEEWAEKELKAQQEEYESLAAIFKYCFFTTALLLSGLLGYRWFYNPSSST